MRALAAVRAHARHLVLGALVAGLLVAPVGPAAVLAGAAVAAALAGRSAVALLAAAAVLAGAAIADARLAALDAGPLASMHGKFVESRAVLLEPLRARGANRSVARVRLLDGPGAREQAVLRVRGAVASGGAGVSGAAGASGGAVVSGAAGASGGAVVSGAAGASGGAVVSGAAGASGGAGASDGPGASALADVPEVGDVLLVAGVVGPLGEYDAYQRRRNAHAAIDAGRVVATGVRRGGIAGALDTVRRRGGGGAGGGGRGPPPRPRQRCCAGWCSGRTSG